MTETVKKLGQMVLTGGTDTLYTVPASTQVLIKSIFVVNNGVVDQTVKIWQSGSADVNVILPTVTLGAGEFATYEGAITMAAADTLKADGDTGITITVEGVEFT